MDIKVLDDGKPKGGGNNEALNQTMSEIKYCLEQQLTVLESIARWSDQTALYTSHLQQIKIAADQTRHYQEARQAADAQVVRLLEEGNAAQQIPDEGQNEADAAELTIGERSVSFLEQIEYNTRITAEQMAVIADATKESTEDKREAREGATVTKQEKEKLDKAKEGSFKQVADEAGGFIGKLVKWFATMGLLLLPLLMGPEKLFETLRLVFRNIGNLFTQLTGFVLNTLGPIISTIMDGLFSIFNHIAGPLGNLGEKIGDLVRKFSPEINKSLEWFFTFLGEGLADFINLLATGIEALPGMITAMSDSFTSMMNNWFNTEGKYDSWTDALAAKFDEWTAAFKYYESSGIIDSFEDMLVKGYNGIIDGINMFTGALIDAVYGLGYLLSWIPGLEHLEMSEERRDELKNEYMISEDRKITDDERDLSRRNAKFIDFSKSDADVDAQIDALDASELTKEALKRDKESYRQSQNQEMESDFTRIRMTSSPMSELGMTGDQMGGVPGDFTLTEFTGLKEALARDDVPDRLAFAKFGPFMKDGKIVRGFDPQTKQMVPIPEEAQMPLTILVEGAMESGSGVLAIGENPPEAETVTTPVTTSQNIIGDSLLDLMYGTGQGSGGTTVSTNVSAGGNQSSSKTIKNTIISNNPTNGREGYLNYT